MGDGNIFCGVREEEIVLSLEYFVSAPSGPVIGLYHLAYCCDASRTSPCEVLTSVTEHLQILVLCFEGDAVRRQHFTLQSSS
jgi:hypothetical protein